MKMKDFIREKRWYLISGGSFLIIFAIITGIFTNSIYLKLESVQKQNELMSSGIKSLETSSAALISSIDKSAQNVGAYSADQSLISSLKTDLESVLAKLSEYNDMKSSIKDLRSLKASLDQINDRLKNLNSGSVNSGTINTPALPAEEDTTTIPDSNIPGSPTASSKGIIKADHDFIVTVKANTVFNMYGYQFNLDYNKSKATYKSDLKSSINGISTIFKKDMSGSLLIGATMIGDKPGYSANDVNICTMTFTAVTDFDLSTLKISGVSTVDSTEKYVENIGGWSIEAKAK